MFRGLKIKIGCPVKSSVEVTEFKKSATYEKWSAEWQIKLFEEHIREGEAVTNRVFKETTCPFCNAKLLLIAVVSDMEIEETPFNKYIELIRIYHCEDVAHHVHHKKWGGLSDNYVTTITHSLKRDTNTFPYRTLVFNQSGLAVSGEMGACGYCQQLFRFEVTLPEFVPTDGYVPDKQIFNHINSISNDELAILLYLDVKLTINLLPAGEVGANRLRKCLEHLQWRRSIGDGFDPVPRYGDVRRRIVEELKTSGDPKNFRPELDTGIFAKTLSWLSRKFSR